jgi:hypothetical protein
LASHQSWMTMTPPFGTSLQVEQPPGTDAEG